MSKILKTAEMLAAYLRLRRFQCQEVPAPGTAGGDGGGKLIDVVYLWRDSHDVNWLAAHAKALAELASDERLTCNHRDLHYLEMQREGGRLDLLRWSLRSLELHFKDLGRVYIVADTPAPAWLNGEHPKLVWVSTRDLIAEPCPYPSFSSQAIESFLYRLSGLSERFIYMNDDFFLSRDVGEEAFFCGEEILVRFGRGVSVKGEPDPAEPGDTSAHKNSNRLLDQGFIRERRLTLKHRPYSLTRTLFAEAEKRFAEAFEATRRHRFRSTRTFALHSCLVPYLALYQQKARAIMPAILAKDMMHWSNDLEKNEEVFRKIANASRNDIGFCIQANGELRFSDASPVQFERLMSGLYPQPSTFERTCPPASGQP